MLKGIVLVLVIVLLSWAYNQTILPPPPKLCGSPRGPPITAPRIKLRDGRHLAYKEHGEAKETANYKIILVHGFSSSRHDAPQARLGIVKEAGIYLVSFDRPGYGESDPDPNQTRKSLAFDIEELADQLRLGSKFYVIGFSMGGQAVWACLKYIPHRLKGAALLAPVVNYWWGGFPESLSKQAYQEQYLQDQWAIRVAHYAPWLTYWWNTQNWFPPSSVVAGKANLSRQDIQLLPKLAGRQNYTDYVTQQGMFESKLRDMMVGFGRWEFDPMDLQNAWVQSEGSVVHLWQGDEDGLVPVTLQRYIVGKLPWIEYHEVAGAGHLFPHDDAMGEAILRTLLLGEKWP